METAGDLPASFRIWYTFDPVYVGVKKSPVEKRGGENLLDHQ